MDPLYGHNRRGSGPPQKPLPMPPGAKPLPFRPDQFQAPAPPRQFGVEDFLENRNVRKAALYFALVDPPTGAAKFELVTGGKAPVMNASEEFGRLMFLAMNEQFSQNPTLQKGNLVDTFCLLTKRNAQEKTACGTELLGANCKATRETYMAQRVYLQKKAAQAGQDAEAALATADGERLPWKKEAARRDAEQASAGMRSVQNYCKYEAKLNANTFGAARQLVVDDDDGTLKAFFHDFSKAVQHYDLLGVKSVGRNPPTDVDPEQFQRVMSGYESVLTGAKARRDNAGTENESNFSPDKYFDFDELGLGE